MAPHQKPEVSDPRVKDAQGHKFLFESPLINKSADQLRTEFLEMKSNRDLSALLNVKYSSLIYHVFKMADEQKYTIFEIAKRSGGKRQISAPITALKLIQQKLNWVLRHVYKPKKATHGFVVERSIVSNAKAHVGKRYVLNVDLENFFPSIHIGRVIGLFMAIPYKLNREVAVTLAKICCYKTSLPQGAPTSPVISNMICSKMDSQLTALANDNQCHYSRYADDLTFSCSSTFFPTGLARFISIHETEIGGRLKNVITENSFKINTAKVRLQINSVRQEVTGLTTNKIVNVKQKFVRQVRAMLHAWEKYGYDAAEVEYHAKYNKKHRGPFMPKPSFESVVRGKIGFIQMVKGKNDPIYIRYRKKFESLPGAKRANQSL